MNIAELTVNNLVWRVFQADSPPVSQAVQYVQIPDGISVTPGDTQWNGAEFVPYVSSPVLTISVREFTERMGFPALSNVAVFIRGGIPPTRATAGTLEEQGTVDAAWKYAQQLGTLDLTTQAAADLLGLLASLSLISWGDVSTLLAGGSLTGA